MSDVTHSSHLQCIIDCTSLLDAYAPAAMQKGEIEAIMVQSTLEKRLLSHHVGWIGGMSLMNAALLSYSSSAGNVMRRDDEGGGNLLLGCRGMLDALSGYTAELQWGTTSGSAFTLTVCVMSMTGSKSEVAFQTTRQLNDSMQGAISTSYSPTSGPGLSFASTQTLTDTIRGTASLVVGPPQEAGAQLSLSQRTEDVVLSTKVQVNNL